MDRAHRRRGRRPPGRPDLAGGLGACSGCSAAFAAWTALGIGWSESAERSAAEARARRDLSRRVRARAAPPRAATAVRRTVIRGRRRDRRGRRARAALAAAPATGSRPTRPPTCSPRGRRLNYPLNYWNGLAALIAIGIPLILWVATSARARRVAGRWPPPRCRRWRVAAYYTLSRGGAIEIARRRWSSSSRSTRAACSWCRRPSIAGVGSALAVAAAAQRGALADGLTNAAADSQGSEMLAVVMVTSAPGSALVAGRDRARRAPPALLRMPTRRRGRRPLGRGRSGRRSSALVGALASGAPGKLADGWEEFKDPGGPTDTAQRLRERRRQRPLPVLVDRWSTRREAEPLTGIGPGTFEFWWAREGTRTGFVRDAHSLYFEIARRARHPRRAADHRPDDRRARLGRRPMSRRRSERGARCSPPRPRAAPRSRWPPGSTGSGSCR